MALGEDRLIVMSLNRRRKQRLKEKEQSEKEFVSRQVLYGKLPDDFPRALVVDCAPPDPYLNSIPITVETLNTLEVKRIKSELIRRGCHIRGLKPQLVRRLTWAIKRDCR